MRRGFANLGLTCCTAGTRVLQGSHIDPTVPAVLPFQCFADICLSHTKERDARCGCRHGRRRPRARPPPAVTVGASGRRRDQVGHHRGGFARGPPHPRHRLRGPSMAPIGTRRGRGWRATASEAPAACRLHSHQKPFHIDANDIFSYFSSSVVIRGGCSPRHAQPGLVWETRGRRAASGAAIASGQSRPAPWCGTREPC